MPHASTFSTKDLFSWPLQNAERDCIQVRPGVQIHQRKQSLQPPICYAFSIHIGYWSLQYLMHSPLIQASCPWCSSFLVSGRSHIIRISAHTVTRCLVLCKWIPLYVHPLLTHLFESAGVLDASTAPNSLQFVPRKSQVKKPCKGSTFNPTLNTIVTSDEPNMLLQ